MYNEMTVCTICKSDFAVQNISELPLNICPKCQDYYISGDIRIVLSPASGTVVNIADNQPFSSFNIYKNIEIKVDNFEKRIDIIEKKKIKEFEQQDVYEVHKRIERLERKLALLEINSHLLLVRTKFFRALCVAVLGLSLISLLIVIGI